MWRFFLCLAVLSASMAPLWADEPVIVLPEWYESARVQAHSEHPLATTLELTPQVHAQAAKSLGATVLSRIYLNRDEGAWWPSAVGEIEPQAVGRDVAQEISDAMHATGLHVIAYFRHMSDAYCQREHPDWVCRLPNGEPMLEPRGKTKTIFVLCMNSPYREYIQTRVVELAERGVDGIYFDNRHMPDVCTCKYCQEKFEREMGHPMNIEAPEGSPEYLEAAKFVNRSIVEGFRQWSEAAHRVNPDLVFVVKTSLYANFHLPHMDTALLRISEIPGTEFTKPFGHNPVLMRRYDDFAEPRHDDQEALGWSIVRDGAQGRPPHMWIPHLWAETDALYSTAAAVTYGCVAALNIRLSTMPGDLDVAREIFPSSLEMGRRVSPYLAYARPMPLATLHISERARNARLPRIDDLWAEVFGVGLGGCRALKEEHVPWTVISDLGLAEGIDPRTRLLILPWPEELSEAEAANVAAFEQRGGTVVRLEPDAGWHLASKLPGLLKDLRAKVRETIPGLPVRVEGPERMHTVCYEKPGSDRLTVCLANTWGWFRSTRTPTPAVEQGDEPPPCEGVTITLERPDREPPTRAFDAVRGKALPLEIDGDVVRIEVPAFQINACIVVEP